MRIALPPTFAAVAMLALAACTSTTDLAPNQGRSFTVENRSYDDVWSAAVTAAAGVGAITESRKDLGTVRALRGAGAFTWGDAIAVFVTPADPNARRFTVSAVSRPVSSLQITGQDFSETLIASIRAQLRL